MFCITSALDMQLSIVIVNYNVRYFLEQCLLSIDKARQGFEIEVIVVDNNSTDDSLDMVKSRFPGVILIKNEANYGFSAANNQGIKISKGQYVLLLNPDTILSEDTLTSCYHYMQNHDEAGAVCVKMIDGSGKYLPESKRGKPTLSASFFKMTGLYQLAPKSKFFNAYYAGHIDQNTTASIEVMTGAFMFLRKEVIDKIGFLDDTFFMYGEDIDYSYRILEAGYKNVYLPTTTIIHFKGESTKKATLNYTKIFYHAMIIFVKKHYKGKSSLYVFFLQIAVIFKAAFSFILERLFKALPVIIDTTFIFTCLLWLKTWWGNIYFEDAGHINETFDTINAPIYTIFWIIGLLLSGHYRKNTAWFSVFKGIISGTAVILVVYALLEVEYRNSRTIILWGGLCSFAIVVLTKWVKNFIFNKKFGFLKSKKIKYAIISHSAENDRIKSLISKSGQSTNYCGRISPNGDEEGTLGSIKHLNEIVDAYKLDELIFSQKDISAFEMMKSMAAMQQEVDFRVAPDDALSIISSGDKNKQGELLTIGLNFQIATQKSRLNKRIFDVVLAIKLLVLSPIIILSLKKKGQLFSNIFAVLKGNLSWVGYAIPIDTSLLPNIKPGIIPCADIEQSEAREEIVNKENLYYARNYNWWKDFEIILKNINHLDAKIK